MLVIKWVTTKTRRCFLPLITQITRILSAGGAYSIRSVLSLRDAQDLYLVCRAAMSPIAKGEAPADGKITLILLLI